MSAVDEGGTHLDAVSSSEDGPKNGKRFFDISRLNAKRETGDEYAVSHLCLYRPWIAAHRHGALTHVSRSGRWPHWHRERHRRRWNMKWRNRHWRRHHNGRRHYGGMRDSTCLGTLWTHNPRLRLLLCGDLIALMIGFVSFVRQMTFGSVFERRRRRTNVFTRCCAVIRNGALVAAKLQWDIFPTRHGRGCLFLRSSSNLTLMQHHTHLTGGTHISHNKPYPDVLTPVSQQRAVL